MDLEIQAVIEAISNLYSIDSSLIDRDLCERCLVHRLARHLEHQQIFSEYFVDCEFNKEFDDNGNRVKQLSNENGNYVDILIHKRNYFEGDNLICIEAKKSSNRNKLAIQKDIDNLKILTSNRFKYKFGFFINLAKSYNRTEISVYANGEYIKSINLN